MWQQLTTNWLVHVSIRSAYVTILLAWKLGGKWKNESKVRFYFAVTLNNAGTASWNRTWYYKKSNVWDSKDCTTSMEEDLTANEVYNMTVWKTRSLKARGVVNPTSWPGKSWRNKPRSPRFSRDLFASLKNMATWKLRINLQVAAQKKDHQVWISVWYQFILIASPHPLRLERFGIRSEGPRTTTRGTVLLPDNTDLIYKKNVYIYVINDNSFYYCITKSVYRHCHDIY